VTRRLCVFKARLRDFLSRFRPAVELVPLLGFGAFPLCTLAVLLSGRTPQTYHIYVVILLPL